MSWTTFQAQRLQMLSKQPKAILPAMEFQNSLFLTTDLSTSQINSNYLQENGDFEHKPIDPYNSQVNGKVESAVKKTKKILRKSKKSDSDAFLALLNQRKTPAQDIGSSPVQHYYHSAYSSQPRSINPEQEKGQMKEKLAKQAEYYNRNLPALEEGDVIRTQPFKLGQKEWKASTQ